MQEIYTENSSELEDLREEYKNELILLHASLKALNRDLDFSDILKPLLAETGPAMAHVPRLSKQIDRMKKYLNEAEAKAKAQSPAQTSGGSSAATTSAAAPRPCPARDGHPRGRGGRRRPEPPPGIVPQEVGPSWGELKRYAAMDYHTYVDALQTAREIYDGMLASSDGAKNARVKDLSTRAKGQMTNNYLQFENIRSAALAGDFTQIRIGYYRNEALLTARAENNPGRRKFIAWAVAQLKERHPAHVRQEELLQIFPANKVPREQENARTRQLSRRQAP